MTQDSFSIIYRALRADGRGIGRYWCFWIAAAMTSARYCPRFFPILLWYLIATVAAFVLALAALPFYSLWLIGDGLTRAAGSRRA